MKQVVIIYDDRNRPIQLLEVKDVSMEQLRELTLKIEANKQEDLLKKQEMDRLNLEEKQNLLNEIQNLKDKNADLDNKVKELMGEE